MPEAFDESFLDWIAELTEREWAARPTTTLEEFEAAGVHDWCFQQGTRWSGGLSEADVEEIEQRLAIRFPPDYRLFLRRLHCPDRPMVRAGYDDDGRMKLEPWWGITNWRMEQNPICSMYDWVVDGFVFDVEKGGLWRPEWGTRPEDENARRKRVVDAIAAAPRLIPIGEHTCLVAEPCRAGNPVLSIIQSDIVAYGADLRRALIMLFGGSVGRDFLRSPIERGVDAARAVPFWGKFVD
jgi:hypothetical protein